MNRQVFGGPYLPEGCRGFVTEYGMRPTAQDRRHPTPVATELRSSDGIDATRDRVQASFDDAVLNGMRGVTKLEQLPPRNDAVLLFGESPSARTRSWNS